MELATPWCDTKHVYMFLRINFRSNRIRCGIPNYNLVM